MIARSRRRTQPRLAAAAVLALATSSLLVAAPALAAGDSGSSVEVVNTETIQAHLTSDGRIKTQRVYEQLALLGEGEVDLRNPVSSASLRNLDGFSSLEVEDGEQIVTTKVSGSKQLRSVSDYEGDLPLKVSAEYRLDGERMEASDIVGRSGDLQVTYRVTNATFEEREVEIADGRGGTVTRTVQVPIPLVGSLAVVTPSNFTEVHSDQANMAGDGQGGMRLNFTMTLFPPLGAETVELGYTAKITDGVVPGASISALPINPLESPTFKTAAESYQGGATTGGELADGAGQIDGNLLKLRDGASDLLAGLMQLYAGSQELQSGLAGEAAPGARQLSDGAGQLDAGAGQLDDGAGKLAAGTSALRDGTGKLAAGAGDLAGGAGQLDDGAGKLADGAGKLADGSAAARTGSAKLTDGLKQISGGLGQLADTQGLPKAAKGAGELKAGVDQILAGLGDTGNPETLIGGLHKLEISLGTLKVGANEVAGGLAQLLGDASTPSGLYAAKGGVDLVQSGLAAAVAPGGSLDQLLGGLSLVQGLDDCGPLCAGVIETQIKPGVSDSKTNLTAANQGLLQVSGGLATAIGGLSTKLVPGANQIAGGLGLAEAGAGDLKAGAQKAKGGVQQVRDGLVELEEGLAAAVAGILQLSSGADAAYAGGTDLTAGLGDLSAGAGQLDAGAGELATGTGRLRAGAGELAAGTVQLDNGAGELADGAGRLRDGTGTLRDGTGRLSAGALKLAEGLDAAAGGSGQITDGLGQAVDGAPKLVDGAGRLSEEGTSQLVEAGVDTALSYGEMYAVLNAGAERADEEGMAFGAPEGAAGLTAYSLEIAGEDGEGGRNLARGLGGLALLGMTGGGFLLRRRLLG